MRDKTIDCIDVHSGLEDPFLLKKGENSVFLDIVNVCLEVWNETRIQVLMFSLPPVSTFIFIHLHLYSYLCFLVYNIRIWGLV